MSKNFPEIDKDVKAGLGLLRQGAPDVMKAFAGVSMTAKQSKAIDTKTKELMCLAIGIAVHCDGCIAHHMKGAIENGATREEMLETVMVAILMGGGPSVFYGADAVRAFDQFSEEKSKG